jgi:hypothetical protein
MSDTATQNQIVNEAFTALARAVALLCQAGLPECDPATTGPISFMPRALNLNDAAKYLGIGKSTLHAMKTDGVFKTVDVLGRPKYLREDLDAYLDSKKGSRLKVRAGRTAS